jgi:hypothetical protein
MVQSRISWNMAHGLSYSFIVGYAKVAQFSFFKEIVSRDFVVCFWCRSIDLTLYTSGAGSFAFKSSFSYRIFRFCVWPWWAPGRKMAPKFVQVRSSYTRYFVIVYVDYYWRPC